MKVAIYSPYLDTLGGGEKYIATIAEILSKEFDVDLLLDDHLNNLGKDLKSDLESRFNLNLQKVRLVLSPVGKGSGFLKRLSFLKNYDLLFYLTDGSIFYPTAKKNILHIQSPLVGEPAKSLWGKIKLQSWDTIIYNSEFTKTYSEKNWPKKSIVIYPPVDVNKIKSLKKEKYILSVGRFFSYLKDKKHEFLINCFKKLYEHKEIKDWKLNLVGSASEGDREYIDQLKEIAKGFPINFYPNLGYDDLIKLYGQGIIYWHASGFGETDPTKMEHFGISTVEAMSGGTVPIVIGKGGQVEIVENGKSGFLWNNENELIDTTLKIVTNDKLRQEVSENARKRAQIFSKEKFKERLHELINSLNYE